MALDDVLSRIADSLEKIAERMGSPAVPQACRYTLYAWIDEWFETYRAPKLRDDGYDLKHCIDKHVFPNISDKPLNEYTAHDISKALNRIASERMRQITRQIYDQAFREAVRAGYIDRNPVDNVDGISHKYNNGRSLTAAEEAEFLAAAATDKLYPLFRFYLLTGARPSEPLALTNEDISDEYIRIRGTKTVRSDRLLPISKRLRELLKDISITDGRLFPYKYRNVLYHFINNISPQLSFKMTIKDLRHTFGTRCLEAGISMKTVQKWLGHSNYGTTANFYSHITTEFERAELCKLDAKFT